MTLGAMILGQPLGETLERAQPGRAHDGAIALQRRGVGEPLRRGGERVALVAPEVRALRCPEPAPEIAEPATTRGIEPAGRVEGPAGCFPLGLTLGTGAGLGVDPGEPAPGQEQALALLLQRLRHRRSHWFCGKEGPAARLPDLEKILTRRSTIRHRRAPQPDPPGRSSLAANPADWQRLAKDRAGERRWPPSRHLTTSTAAPGRGGGGRRRRS